MKQSGIYKIYNKANGDFYIGSSIDLVARWKNHKSQLIRGIHHSIHLQRAWNKYGEDSFCFEIIEFCPPLDAITREQYFIDSLSPKYNISPTAGNTLGVKQTEIARKNMSEAKKKMTAATAGFTLA